MLPVAGRVADVWHTFDPSPEAWDVVRRAADEAGRDPAAIARSTSLSLSQPGAAVRRQIETARDHGITILIVSWPSEGKDVLERFASEVLPAYG